MALTQEQMDRAIRLFVETMGHCFISANVPDRNLEASNVVDALDKIAEALFAVADAIETGNGRPERGSANGE